MVRRGGYGKYFYHRFGWLPRVKAGNKVVWIQAVSVGEVEALEPLLSQMQQAGISVYLTTTTSTGFRVAQQKYRNVVSQIAYFPLDFWFFSHLAWARIRPFKAILMESELWPEHLFQAYKHKVPVYIINGRCSDKTYKNYKIGYKFVRIVFGFVSKILASSEYDAQRLREFCPINVSVDVVGNLKVDAALNGKTASTKSKVNRSDLGESWENARILLGASTWHGEEEMLVQFYTKVKVHYPELKLILVPRHVERTPTIEIILKQYGVHYGLRTSHKKDADVYVVDTTGELKFFVCLANYVFIGKSLAPNFGGQTPIEAAAFGKPMVYGPHMENFKSICAGLERVNGAVRCQNEEDVQEQLLRWLDDPADALHYGQSAQSWIMQNQGATQRTMQAIFFED